MGFQLNLAKYQRTARRMIPTSLPNLVSTYYMLEHLVKEIYGIQAHDINTITVVNDIGGGLKGNLSDSGRLVVRVSLVNGIIREYNWFVKVMPQNSLHSSEFNVFSNEIEFYQGILPAFQKFVQSEGLGELFGDFDVPQILYAKSDDSGAIVVLEDVIADGYHHERDENGDPFLSVEAATVAVSSIARIHAVSVAMQNKENCDLAAEHPTLAESGMLWTQTEMTERLALMKESYCELLKQSDELDSPTLLKRFKKSFDSTERLLDLCQRRCDTKGKFSCLQHGDFHFNNLLFKKENGKLKVKVVDWQLSYTGKTTGDLSYLLMSSLSPENRESFENVIKNEYFNAYHSTIKMLTNSNVEEKFDKEYNDSLPLSFFLSCGNIMTADLQDRSVQFSYDMCKEAALKEII